MAETDEPDDRRTAKLEAHASGSARINQAGRDLHLHYQDGVRELRRAEPGAGVDECPYPGMTYFEREQARWFFGRDRLTAKLVARLDGRLRAGGIQVVVAPSGAGKSSLLNAGLLPRLEQGALPGSTRWPTLVLTPTGDPLATLATRIASLAGVDPTVLAEDLADDPARCARVLRDHLPERRPDTRVVLVVDQFEELFTLCADPKRQRAFIRALACLAGPGGDGRPLGLVVVGVRADFYASCANDPDLRDALEDSPLVVGPMSETEIREAILYPARDVGLDLEPGLIELLLADLGGTTADGDEGNYEAGRLALLAHALRATWQQRHGHTLTVAGYRDTGGIAHAVATTADRIFNGLDPDGQAATPALFLRLTKIGDGTEDTRRRVLRAELLDGLSPDTVQPVVDAFTRGRLLTQDQDTVQITHEALLRAWPRLRQWIDGDRAGNLTRQELEEAAAGWDREGRDASRLYRGTRLAVAHALASSGHGKPNLSPVASAFLTASTAQERRARRRRVQGVVAALAVVTVASGLILQQNVTARRERDTAISHQVKVEADRLRGTDVSLAAQLDITAYRLSPNPDLGATILSDATTTLSSGPIANQTERASSVAFSPDGRTLASGSGSEDGSVRLWNVADPARPISLGQPLTGHTSYLNSLAFSPDGHTLASGGHDNTVRLWNVADSAHPTALGQPLAIHSGISGSVTFSPDGRLLAASDVDDEVRLWNVADPAHPVALGLLPGARTTALSAAFSPNGHILASGGFDGAIRFWDVADPIHPVALGQTPATGDLTVVVSIAFGPDGYTLVSGGVNGLRLWNVYDPAKPIQLGQPLVTGYVATVRFSPDGRTLAGEGGDGTVRLWNVYNPAQPVPVGHPLTGHTDRVRSVAFRPDGGTLASASNDGTMRLWHIPQPVPLAPTGDGARAVAISPDWRMLARVGFDRALRLWNMSDPAHPVAVGETPIPDDVNWVAFSPDGHTLASVGSGGVRLWNVSDPARPNPLGQPFTVRADWARTLTFGPDGHTVASVGLNGNMQLWDVSDPARPTGLGRLADKLRIGELVAFSPDGRILASADTIRENVWFWNIADPAHPVLINEPLRGAAPSGNMSSIAFSPDGRTLAGGDSEGRMWLWDLSEPAHPSLVDQSSTGAARKLVSMVFSPDGHTLAGGDSDGTTWLWNVSEPPRHLIQLGQPLTGRHTQRGVTVAFSPDGHTLASIDGAGAVWLWALDVEQAAQRICSATTNTLTRANWAQLVSADLSYDPPCR